MTVAELIAQLQMMHVDDLEVFHHDDSGEAPVEVQNIEIRRSDGRIVL
ncbi:hypothetical protein KNU66_gp80 [Gordonia phage McKinley]|uniref:Uncharacterized protein n=1 Tax=Gordonia phage McKinley TaxID=2588507 RepID=A0A4Y6EPM8_9CAUD|nr:hypothetical protein KNU66_gp80 [Gordonia phage McKinley]QDF19501.1 hypothetical protein SEA_MCKINLEY_80 [Gordonia phage McKinley]